MKKILGIICALLLVGSFAMAQYSSDPIAVDLVWQYEGGIAMTISETFLDWGLIPLLVDPAVEEDWYPCPTVPQVVISFKLPATSICRLICETPADFMYNTQPKNPADFMHVECNGGDLIFAETPLPNPEDGQKTLWDSTTAGQKREGNLLFKVWRHQEFGGVEYQFTGQVIFTAIEVTS